MNLTTITQPHHYSPIAYSHQHPPSPHHFFAIKSINIHPWRLVPTLVAAWSAI